LNDFYWNHSSKKRRLPKIPLRLKRARSRSRNGKEEAVGAVAFGCLVPRQTGCNWTLERFSGRMTLVEAQTYFIFPFRVVSPYSPFPMSVPPDVKVDILNGGRS
jgi:hypothetical protein